MIVVTGRAQESLPIASDAANVSSAEKRTFLEAICPSHVTGSRCSVCPAEMPQSAETWELRAIIFGHFIAPRSNDALVSGFGCEPHVKLTSGAYLFTKQGAAWRKVRYTAGEEADDCKKITGADGRDRLICEAAGMHQGAADEFVYWIESGDGQQDDPLHLFFTITDSRGSCVQLADGSVRTGHIDSVTFAGDRILVHARGGKAIVPAEALQKCQPGANTGFEIMTGPVRYEFRFDGQKVIADPRNPATDEYGAAVPTTSYRLAGWIR